ncbi:MAG: hypothetical protein ABR985_03835 [Methanotrichaceae archaeon]|jgi:hypothetical protein
MVEEKFTTEEVMPMFIWVRDTFFPKMGKEWTVIVTEETEPSWIDFCKRRMLDMPLASCCFDEKLIRIAPMAPYEMEEAILSRAPYLYNVEMALEQILIHECAHAVTNCGHSEKWQQCMIEVAERAADLDDQDLPVHIFREAEFYSEHSDDEGMDDASRKERDERTLKWIRSILIQNENMIEPVLWFWYR